MTSGEREGMYALTKGGVPIETQISTPEISQSLGPTDVAPKKRVLWKWSIAVTLVLIAILFWRCGTGLIEGRQLSANGVQQFHALLNTGQHEQIYDGASDAFRSGGSKQDLIKFFQSIHRKLGDAGSSTLNRLNVAATPTGTYITAVYRTTFMEGEAVETFTWLKSGHAVVLNGYNIQSMKLIVE
jgi:hypothetical protein